MSTSSSSASEIGPPLPHFSSLASPLHATRPRQKVTWDRSRAALALLLAVVVGVAVDQAVTTDVVGTAGTLAGAVALVALAVTLRPRGTELVALSLAGTLVPWLTLRSSGWLIGPDVVAICALTMLAASGGTPPTTFLAAARRLWAIVPSGVVVPGELRRAVQAALPQGSPQRRLALLRGLAIAAPLGGLLLVLLASGDRLFATLLGAAGLGAALDHAVVAVIASLAWFAVVVDGLRPSAEQRTSAGPRLGVSETAVVLSMITAVLAVYVGTTLTAATAGRAYVERHTGLTYAQYARSGFFQLVAVVAIVLSVLIALRTSISGSNGRRALLPVALVAAGLTLAVVAVSILRLQTYRSVFGLTMLRFSTTVFAAWLGVVLVLVAVSLVWAGLQRRLPSWVVLSCYLTLVIVNLVNPEAVVADENIARAGQVAAVRQENLDGSYLAEHLGDDAVPTIVTHLAELTVPQRAALLSSRCSDGPGDHGWSWNLSRHRSAASLASVCPAWRAEQVVVGN